MRVRWACHTHLARGYRGCGECAGEVGVSRPPWLEVPEVWGSVRVRWACHAHLARGYRGCGECAGEVGVSHPPCWGAPGVWGVCG